MGRFQTDFGHQTSDFGVWTWVLDFWETPDFGYRHRFWPSDFCFWTPGFEQTYVVCLLQTYFRQFLGLLTNFGHQTLDFCFSDRLHRPRSDFGLWTLDFGFWPSNILRTSDFKSLISDGRWTADFGHISCSFQTLDILQTNFGQTSDFGLHTPTSDIGLRTDFEHQTSNFQLLTLDFGLRFQI